MQIILGLTGGSGTGKSLAAAYLKKQGAAIIDADIIARAILEPGKPALSEVLTAFPDVFKDGTLDRKKLGAKVFADENALHRLNDITHKYIIAEIENALSQLNSPLVVIDAPLLLECGLDRLCTATIGILSDKELRISRIIERDGLSEENARNRIESQNDDSFYKIRCDYIVYNNGDATVLTAAIDGILKELLV